MVKPGPPGAAGPRRAAQDDGSFAHTPENGGNLLATTQAFYALTALQRARDGKPTLYDMSDVTP